MEKFDPKKLDPRNVEWKNVGMEYLNKLTRSVYTVKDAVSSVLPGNPVNREFTAKEHIASAGPGLCWKIYDGFKNTNKKEVAIWVLLKKDVECWPAREKGIIVELLKRGVSQLTKLRHPRLLIVEHPLEESRDCLAFCTEPIFASLANSLGRVDNMPSILPTQLTEFKFLDIEIKHGLFQVSEALSFLHCDARILHGNICPESVIINSHGSWKLAGFDFCQASTSPNDKPPSYPLIEWDNELMPCVQPTLDYMAPEYVLAGRCDAFADIYSVGVLAFAVFNKGKPPMNNGNNLNTFKKNAQQLKAVPPNLVRSLPEDLRDDIKMCLNFTPDLRPDATQLSKVAYFEDVLVKTLNYLESLGQMDNTQKSQFFKGLPNVLHRFPKRALLQKVLPMMTAEFLTPELIPFILPNIFTIVEQTTDEQFCKYLLPPLIPVFAMNNPPQIPLLLLQKMDILLGKTPPQFVQAHLIPLVCNSLDSNAAQIQELCLSLIPRISNLVDRNSMKSELMPKLLKLSVEGQMLSVKVNSLVCIGKLLESLEKWMVTEQILPALPKINSKEPGVLMACLGIYKLAFNSRKHGISKELCAKNALPFLIAASVETNLNVAQFESFMALIRKMLEKVEKDQLTRLSQLSSMQEDQRAGVTDFTTVFNSAGQQKLNTDLKGVAIDGIPAPQNENGATQTRKKGPLTLEEKKRLAAEQESSVRFHCEKKSVPLTPNKPIMTPLKVNEPYKSIMQPKIPNNPVDLSASLGPSMKSSSPQWGNMKGTTVGNPIGTSLGNPLGTPGISMGTTSQNSFGSFMGSMENPMVPSGSNSSLNSSMGSLNMTSNMTWNPMNPTIRPPPNPNNSVYNSPPMMNNPSPINNINNVQNVKRNIDLSSFDSLVNFGGAPAAQNKSLNSSSNIDDLLG